MKYDKYAEGNAGNAYIVTAATTDPNTWILKGSVMDIKVKSRDPETLERKNG